MKDDTDIGPLVNLQALENTRLSWLRDSIKEGAEITYRRHRMDVKINGVLKGYFYSPTIFKDVTPKIWN